ncbi:MAG: ABC transporter permease [Bacteroidia bacterium]|nr:ABC transporter permease [Bacteroidia bacterium]NNC85479.1 ABC transporter permease [Bacteroidia bacterium]NNM15042.1 ABC transporter permease [Bacteroidia bacterium]
MADDNKLARRTLRTSTVSTIIAISLVLFLVGCLATVLLHANKIKRYVQENIEVSISLDKDASEKKIQSLITTVKSKSLVRETTFITSEEAARDLSEQMGEDFIDFLGYNPLSPTLLVKLNAEFAQKDSIEAFKSEVEKQNIVEEVYYNKSLVQDMNENLRLLSFIILGFSALLSIIAIALINNTIRLSLYAKRLIIKSMQLVGATRSIIRRPFLFTGMMQGIYGSLIALALLAGLIYLLKDELPELIQIQDTNLWLMLTGSIILSGILISLISTYFAVNKYLRKRPDELY